MTNVLPLEILLTRLPINETTISRARFSTLLESPDLSLRQVSITQDHIADSWNANSFIWVNRDPRSSSKSLPKRHLNPFPAPITRKQNIFRLKPTTLVIACCRHWLRSTKTVRPKVSTSRCWRSCKTDRCVASRWCNASSSHLHIHSKATTVQHAVAEFLEAKMQRRVASPSDWTRQTSLSSLSNARCNQLVIVLLVVRLESIVGQNPIYLVLFMNAFLFIDHVSRIVFTSTWYNVCSVAMRFLSPKQQDEKWMHLCRLGLYLC